MNELIRNMEDLWRRGQDPAEWGDRTKPRPSLIWKDGHPSQTLVAEVKNLLAMGHLLDMPVKVVASHRSKSVELPVGMFRVEVWGDETVYMFTRDNFHDLKITVVSTCPIKALPYHLVHTLWTKERYEEEKRRSFEYCRPNPEKNFKGSHDWDPAKYETDEWYDSWSGGTLLRHEGKIFRCGSVSSCYYEGIERVLPEEVFQRYEYGRQQFAIEVPGGVVKQMEIMQGIFTGPSARP